MKHAPPPDGRILEENLARLIRRAYIPVRPTPRFRAELRAHVRAEVERLAPPALAPQRGPRRWTPLVAIAAAAAVLLVVLFGLRESGVFDPPRGRAEILARGEVALREDPHEAWDALDAALAEEGLEITSPWLEVATPPHGAFELREGRARLTALAATELTVEHHVAGLHAELVAGAIEIDRPSVPELKPWTVRTGQGVVGLSSARLTVEHTPTRVGLHLEEGSAWVVTAGDPIAIPAGREVFLVAGALEPPAEPPPPVDPPTVASGREPVDVAEVEPPAPPVAPPSITVRGRVVVETSGEAVPRFRVALLRESAPNTFFFPVFTEFEDADGFFAWEGVAPLRYEVIVHAEGCAVWRSPLTAADDEGTILVEAWLAPGGAVRGVVLDPATGTPIADAVVASMRDAAASAIPLDLESMDFWLPASAHTDAGGSFALPHLSAGDHVLRVSAPGFAARWLDPIAVTEGGETIVGTVELRAGGHLQGTVIGANGAPAAEMRLIVVPMSAPGHLPTSFGMAVTDETGSYRIDDLPPGLMLAILLVDEGSAAPPMVRPFPSTEGETTRLDFRIEAPGTRVVGRLFDAEGAPVPSRNLALVQADPAGVNDDLFAATSSDEEGAWIFEAVRPGRYFLLAVLDQSGDELLLLDELEVPPEPEVRHDVHLQRGEISGRVIEEATGQATGECIVTLLRRDPASARIDFAGQVRTDAEGRWSFRTVPAGTYLVNVLPQRGLLGYETSEEFVLDELRPRVTRDLALHPGTRARVLAVDESGEALSGVALQLFRLPEDHPVSDQHLATDATGEILFPGLRPGRYRVRGERPGFEIVDLEFEARLGSVPVVRLVLPPKP